MINFLNYLDKNKDDMKYYKNLKDFIKEDLYLKIDHEENYIIFKIIEKQKSIITTIIIHKFAKNVNLYITNLSRNTEFKNESFKNDKYRGYGYLLYEIILEYLFEISKSRLRSDNWKSMTQYSKRIYEKFYERKDIIKIKLEENCKQKDLPEHLFYLDYSYSKDTSYNLSYLRINNRILNT